MVLLSIDPGTRSAGFAVLARINRSVSLLHYGTFAQKTSTPLSERVGSFFERMNGLCLEWKVTDIALETAFMGKNAQNFLKLGYLRGALYVLAHQKSLIIHEYAPSQIKQSVAGLGSADKQTIARVVSRLFPGIACNLTDDTTDAIALGLCALWRVSR
jgi:crossover junction endodeoxyribonuclease RuvC